MDLQPGPVCRRALVLALVSLGLAGHAVAATPMTEWKVVTSQHFIVRTDATAREYEPLIARLERVHEALSMSFFAGVPILPANVLLLSDPRDFAALSPKDLAGYYVSNLDGVAQIADGLLVFSSGAADFEVAASTAAHELAHHFLQALSDRVPIWLHEGFAKYVGALRIHGDVVEFDGAEVSRSWAEQAAPVPLAQLFAASPTDFHGASARAQYLTAWLLVRHTLAGVATRPALGRWFQEFVARSVRAPTPAAQAAALRWANRGMAQATLERAIVGLHRAPPAAATALSARPLYSVTLPPTRPRPLTVTAADPAVIATLCKALRERARD